MNELVGADSGVRSLNVLGLIPARGGSKGIPRKNIKLLGGKPLLEYTAEAAIQSKSLTRVVLSTDDEEIADLGRRLGLEVPFFRPAELARDGTPTLPVVQHAIRFLEAGSQRPGTGIQPPESSEAGDCSDHHTTDDEQPATCNQQPATSNQNFDIICLLQPTSPLRTATTIDACVELLIISEADTVITVLPVPAEHNPHWVYFSTEGGWLRLSTGEVTPIPRRQDLPPAWHREGSVYVVRRDIVMRHNTLFGPHVIGSPVDPSWSVNLDTVDDWERAESMLRHIPSAAKQVTLRL